MFEVDEPEQVLRTYLQETARLITDFDAFEVLAHLDYPVRYWPRSGKPYLPTDFEDEYRHVLGLLADRGKVLEVNTRVSLHSEVLRWWREAGGVAICFASDAHEASGLAKGFRQAADMAESQGFRADRDLNDFWRH